MENNICILLGAGVSVEQGLPQWPSLVRGVADYYNISLEVDKENVIQTMGIVEDDRLSDIQKKLLEHSIFVVDEKDKRAWARRQIATATRMCLKKSIFNKSLDIIKGKMNLMRKLVECVYERTSHNLMTTIITYNFDDYFEFAYKCLLNEKHIINQYDTQVRSHTIGTSSPHLPSGVSNETLVNVYHVHGYIPTFDEVYGHELYNETKSEYKNRNSALYEEYLNGGVIFSGNDYNTLIDDAIVGWTNMIQYICYSQLPVSIIGFSLSDANFRMLVRRLQKSNEIMKGVKIFLGYTEGNDQELKQANTSQKTVEYILKGICDNGKPETKISEFIHDYPNEVATHINQFLI